MKDIYGKWPGDETEEELLSALEEMDTPEQRSPTMPDEFKLRPHTYEPGASDHERGFVGFLNHAHEQGARALAEAVVAEAIAATIGPDTSGDWAKTAKAYNDGIETAIDIINRLVPPKDQASNKETDK